MNEVKGSHLTLEIHELLPDFDNIIHNRYSYHVLGQDSLTKQGLN